MLKKFLKFMSLFLMAGLVLLTACDKEDDDDNTTPPVIILDGLYVKGAATALTALDTKGVMSETNNEVGQVARASLYELYVAVKADAAGFNIIEVSGATQTVYGPGADFATVDVNDVDTEEPQVSFQRGSFAETATPFTVPEDGLYHVVIDTELGVAAVVPVKYWGLIGGATPNGWSGDVEMASQGFDLNTMTFEVADVIMEVGDFKFRYDGGWKLELDTTDSNPDNHVKVNCNFGGAVDALEPGGSNISNAERAIYKATMVWTLGEGYVASVDKTGDLQPNDYTDTELGLVGDGIMVGGVQHNWEETIMLHTPVVENETDYTWTYASVEITAAGSFKIREGQDWTGKSIGYNEVTMAGTSADNFETNNDGNFVPLEDGVFDLVLYIDAVHEAYTLTVNPAGVEAIYMLGDGTTAGWDNTIAIPVEGAEGVYTLTTDFPGGGGIKFITELGAWQPQYGTDATGTWEAGPLFENDGTGSDPDPIPGPPDAGTYTITVNTNDMTYTMVAG